MEDPSTEPLSLELKLDKIRSPNLENQQQKAVVLSAVETTLREQATPATPTAYFVALLSLLKQSISPSGQVHDAQLAASSVYLLDVVTPFVPAPLLRSRFDAIIALLSPLLSQPNIDAPLVKVVLGCLESLLIAQDSAAWTLSPAQISPRAAMTVLLRFSVDSRPKVRRRALHALQKVLQTPPPSPSLDHPAAGLCAETALASLAGLASSAINAAKTKGSRTETSNQPDLIHCLQLIKAIATSSGGWPAKKIEPLCELLLSITKHSNEYLSMAIFDIFEVIFESMAKDGASVKLSHLVEAIVELQPSQNDAQLLPPWLAVLSRGYDVLAQTEPEETFQNVTKVFKLVSDLVSSSSYNIRVSAAECLISFLHNCVPESVLLEPSVFDEKVINNVARMVNNMLDVKFQAAWMEVFNVVAAFFEAFKWKATPTLDDAIKVIGSMRSNESFSGKKEADAVLGKAVAAIGPERFLKILPLNLSKQKKNEPGRAWLLPTLRDNTGNASLSHFKVEFIPLSEMLFNKAVESSGTEKTMETKIFETLVQQIWSIFPGYCDLPTDLPSAFDQGLAEMLANLLYKQTDLRVDVCKGLQLLVESNQAILAIEGKEDLLAQRRMPKQSAQANVNHLASMTSNILAVLFNVYSQTLPHHRGYILNCINAYLSIIPSKELNETFVRVTTSLEKELSESNPQTQATKQKHKRETGEDQIPLMSHTLMDLIITMAVHLPRESFATLFTVSALTLVKEDDPQLQKKAYKMIPRLASSEIGSEAIQDRVLELQQLVVDSAKKTSQSARRDRLAAIKEVAIRLPASDLSFIPTVLSEVVVCCKETNQKARTQAFDLLITMGERMQKGGTIVSSKVPHLPEGTPDSTASLDEYFRMICGGLTGGTPQVISASVTALTRCLFDFHGSLGQSMMTDVVSALDSFLASPSREIVRSVLGFVKVSVISLPSSLVKPRLPSLIPSLMRWSHEHKDKFRAKVKHILERMVRKFGADLVERYTPDADKKLIHNIRKTRERRKRKKENDADDSDASSDADAAASSSRFESGFDQAIYDSSSESENDGGKKVPKPRAKGKSKRGTFITEEDDEPLDLLSKTVMGNISMTRPLKSLKPGDRKKSKARVNIDGKLVIGMDQKDDENANHEDADAMNLDGADKPSKGGVDAYVEAVAGKNAVQRGQRGKLKFKNQKSGDEMEVDEEEIIKARKETQTKQKRTILAPKKGQFKATSRPKSKIHDFKKARRGLGVPKNKGGRVEKF